MRRRGLLGCGALALAILPAGGALAQAYPNKPIRMVVGFAPGGSTDTIARLINARLAEKLGQPVIVENRPGAAGNIAAEIVARAAPDGYTLYMASMSHTINASLYPKLSFDTVRDFAPVTLVTSSPFVLVVHSGVPAKTTSDLIALAKAKPSGLSFASGGASSHLAGELFNSMAGVKIVHIAYKSSGPAASDLLGGQVGLMFSAPPAVLPHVRTGQLRALGVTSLKRLAGAADIPTIAESGLPGYDVNSWSGVMGPAKLPKEIVAKLHADLLHVMALPDIVSRLPALGLEPWTSTPDEFGKRLATEVAKWAKVVADAGMRQH